MSGSLVNGVKWQTQLFTETHVGNAIPEIHTWNNSICMYSHGFTCNRVQIREQNNLAYFLRENLKEPGIWNSGNTTVKT